ncbi:hypothetical protein HDU96_002196 [Phlyctochytrium bullatum]|nr:hypothetical protein HDU96_002196 [Phlyctochytrium bullatum]
MELESLSFEDFVKVEVKLWKLALWQLPEPGQLRDNFMRGQLAVLTGAVERFCTATPVQLSVAEPESTDLVATTSSDEAASPVQLSGAEPENTNFLVATLSSEEGVCKLLPTKTAEGDDSMTVIENVACIKSADVHHEVLSCDIPEVSLPSKIELAILHNADAISIAVLEEHIPITGNICELEDNDMAERASHRNGDTVTLEEHTSMIESNEETSTSTSAILQSTTDSSYRPKNDPTVEDHEVVSTAVAVNKGVSKQGNHDKLTETLQIEGAEVVVKLAQDEAGNEVLSFDMSDIPILPGGSKKSKRRLNKKARNEKNKPGYLEINFGDMMTRAREVFFKNLSATGNPNVDAETGETVAPEIPGEDSNIDVEEARDVMNEGPASDSNQVTEAEGAAGDESVLENIDAEAGPEGVLTSGGEESAASPSLQVGGIDKDVAVVQVAASTEAILSDDLKGRDQNIITTHNVGPSVAELETQDADISDDIRGSTDSESILNCSDKGILLMPTEHREVPGDGKTSEHGAKLMNEVITDSLASNSLEETISYERDEAISSSKSGCVSPPNDLDLAGQQDSTPTAESKKTKNKRNKKTQMQNNLHESLDNFGDMITARKVFFTNLAVFESIGKADESSENVGEEIAEIEIEDAAANPVAPDIESSSRGTISCEDDGPENSIHDNVDLSQSIDAQASLDTLVDEEPGTLPPASPTLKAKKSARKREAKKKAKKNRVKAQKSAASTSRRPVTNRK